MSARPGIAAWPPEQVQERRAGHRTAPAFRSLAAALAPTCSLKGGENCSPGAAAGPSRLAMLMSDSCSVCAARVRVCRARGPLPPPPPRPRFGGSTHAACGQSHRSTPAGALSGHSVFLRAPGPHGGRRGRPRRRVHVAPTGTTHTRRLPVPAGARRADRTHRVEAQHGRGIAHHLKAGLAKLNSLWAASAPAPREGGRTTRRAGNTYGLVMSSGREITAAKVSRIIAGRA